MMKMKTEKNQQYVATPSHEISCSRSSWRHFHGPSPRLVDQMSGPAEAWCTRCTSYMVENSYNPRLIVNQNPESIQ